MSLEYEGLQCENFPINVCLERDMKASLSSLVKHTAGNPSLLLMGLRLTGAVAESLTMLDNETLHAIGDC